MNKKETLVGIAGIGGIGSNVGKILIRSGVMNLKIVDFDHVEPSNLNRQFYFADQIGNPKVDMLEYNLKKINSNIQIVKEMVRISKENINSIFSECEIIVEGFDLKENKIMLMEELGDKKSLIVSASGVAGENMKNIRVQKFGENCYVTGDFCSGVNSFDIFPPKVFCIASIMAGIVLKHINLES
ncbi:MAG: sulfur carrier protein ThiS adenylyltransferase ThiF [Desulfobacterales bacterium]|nr:sulfur carrier protein ThiS adenylyltransferase ThiF [Desulfobacterales bacterium]